MSSNLKPVRESQKVIVLPPSPNTDVMKVIKNYSLQGLNVLLNTEKGPVFRWLEPRQSIVVPEDYISEQAKTMHARRKIQISN